MAIIVIVYILHAECMVAFHGTTMNTLTRFGIMIFQIYQLMISIRNVRANLAEIDQDIGYLNEIAYHLNNGSDQAGQSYGSSIDISFESNLVSESNQISTT